ncbi:MAG: hypothetical protein F6K10_15745, partial [Moorea sp. SIO2B7]|nr:hypothetical protein [Moorena sp. SIO2B7]
MSISSFVKKVSMGSAGAAFIALGIAGTAQAATFNEVGDAGQTLGTAKSLGNGITQINGTRDGDDPDLYSFFWNGGTFSADTLGSSLFDTQLFLFDSDGLGVIANDDGGFPFPDVFRSGFSINLSQGLYYLGITEFNSDPFSSGGTIFAGGFGSDQTPTGPGGALPLNGWSAASTSGGSYQINISGTAAVPEPA